ncbi:energy transducer TonB [Parvularcula sp. IMCC14364]|uniref:energy transducer TonB n=1 Tax=Parvularcula sp. IMCC14364 TaxID=3067902 RepID=UPI003557FB67
MISERAALYSSYAEALPDIEKYTSGVLQFSNGEGPVVGRVDPSSFDFLGIEKINRDAYILKRVPPQYPSGCTIKVPVNVRHRVTVEFDITENGYVRDPRVISSDFECLELVSMRAVSKWQYEPKLLNGSTVPRFDVRTTFVFVLQN